MTPDPLAACIGELADAVIVDPRWVRDDLSVSILGMILYGLALATGRIIMFLDIEDIDAAVIFVMTERIGAAAKWSDGFVKVAHRSAFDRAYHLANFELIGVGHSYFGLKDQVVIINNIFDNIQRFRKVAGGSH